MIDTTHYCFLPAWVEGTNESRLGYVIELSYPMSVVYVYGCGVIEVKNNKLRFILGRENAAMRVYVSKAFDLDDKVSAATKRVPQVIA